MSPFKYGMIVGGDHYCPRPGLALARLRAKVQFQNKMSHVFLGGVRNRMHEIFDSPKSPFYKSATSFSVGPIDTGDFKAFLKGRFKSAKRKIGEGDSFSLAKEKFLRGSWNYSIV